MKLAIISHTEHYTSQDGTLVGWGPTIREINHLTEIFHEIYHVAMLSDELAPKSALSYTSKSIKFVPIRQVGGKDLMSKAAIITNAPETLSRIKEVLKKVDFFQFRAPTGIGVYLIPYLTTFSSKKGWFKYAGNWNQDNPPTGYAIQRKLLRLQSRIVTINGSWPNQPEHCLTFENPCLSDKNLEEGKLITSNKSIEDKLHFCFVGRLEDQKGVSRIIEALGKLTSETLDKIGSVYLVGSGPKFSNYQNLAKNIATPIKFLGALSNEDVHEVYKKSHFLLLPTTASEGFPKVIAEAINFGCVPIVSDVSSITQYVEDGVNGIVLKDVSPIVLKTELEKVVKMKNENFKKLQENQDLLAEKFTFTYYNSRIKNEIINL